MNGADLEFTEAELAALDETTRAMVLRGQAHARKHVEAETRAAKFAPDNRVNKVSKKTQHIRDLVKANHDATPAQIRKLDTAHILKGMKDSTLENQVYAARKFHGIA